MTLSSRKANQQHNNIWQGRGDVQRAEFMTATYQVMHSITGSGQEYVRTILLCKAKKQYLLSYKVSRYCFLALHGNLLWHNDSYLPDL